MPDKILYQKRRAQGLCPVCGSKSLVKDYVLCYRCRRKKTRSLPGTTLTDKERSSRLGRFKTCPAVSGGPSGCAWTMAGLNAFCRSRMDRARKSGIGEEHWVEVAACKKCPRAEALRNGVEDAPLPEGARLISSEELKAVNLRLRNG